MVTVRLVISGKVQGVFFRATAKKVAEENKLTGWVRNTDKGNVEVIVTGNKQDIEKFTEWCKNGPRNSEVSGVNITYIEETIFKEF